MKAHEPRRILKFHTAETLARLVAEARLQELLNEAKQIEVWIQEARQREQVWAANYGLRSGAIRIVKH